MPDWRHDLSYPLKWSTRWHSWYLPTPLWFWDEDEMSDLYGRDPDRTPLCGWPMFYKLTDEALTS